MEFMKLKIELKNQAETIRENERLASEFTGHTRNQFMHMKNNQQTMAGGIENFKKRFESFQSRLENFDKIKESKKTVLELTERINSFAGIEHIQ